MQRGLFVSSAVSFAAASTVASAAGLRARQFLNDVPGSTLDLALRDMWAKVRDDTSGALDVTVYPENDGIPGGDPQALAMLQRGELQFFTLNGAILSNVVRQYDIQTLPFVFRNRAEVFRVQDGALGAYLVDQIAPHGIRAFVGGQFENGIRQVTTTTVPIHTVADVRGIRWRTPKSKVLGDFVRAVGAVPVVVNFNGLVESIRSGDVEAQDNPLAFLDGQKLYLYQRYLNLTNQAWAGFNFIANGAFYARLSARVQSSIERRLHEAVTAQRHAQNAKNEELLTKLPTLGMQIVHTATSGFKAKLGPFYTQRRQNYGETAWHLLETSLGRPVGPA